MLIAHLYLSTLKIHESLAFSIYLPGKCWPPQQSTQSRCWQVGGGSLPLRLPSPDTRWQFSECLQWQISERLRRCLLTRQLRQQSCHTWSSPCSPDRSFQHSLLQPVSTPWYIPFCFSALAFPVGLLCWRFGWHYRQSFVEHLQQKWTTWWIGAGGEYNQF